MEKDFKTVWEEYMKTDEYKESIKILESKGINYPYSENILYLAFSAGYRGNSESN